MTKENQKKSFKGIASGLKTLGEGIANAADKAGINANTIEEAVNTIKEKGNDAAEKAVTAIKETNYTEVAKKTTEKAGRVAKVAKEKTVGAVQTANAATLEFFDENGNGEIDIEDIIIKGLKTPGVRINREEFLRKEFYKKFSESVVNEAIRTNPMTAGISSQAIDEIADQVIEFERRQVSGISAALGMPGGVAMAATIPADIAQYYGYMLRATQKLLYLYGFPQIDTTEEGNKFDSETINILIICMGVMYGAAGANNALKSIAKALGAGVEKKLVKTALTKGTIYPIVKSVANFFRVKMTKEVFAGFFGKAIPIVGGVIGGGVTYLSFKPCCVKLQKSLQDTRLSNRNYKEDVEELMEISDAEFEEIEE